MAYVFCRIFSNILEWGRPIYIDRTKSLTRHAHLLNNSVYMIQVIGIRDEPNGSLCTIGALKLHTIM